MNHERNGVDDEMTNENNVPANETGATSLGSTADISGNKDREDEIPIVFTVHGAVTTLSAPASAEAEAISALRTRLLVQHVRDGRRAITICAPDKDARIALLAVELAIALAQGSVKTLLIDSDLRNSPVSRYVHPSRPVPGLTDVVRNTISYADAIQADVIPNLSILYAGEPTDNPQELLSGPHFKAIADMSLRDFDVTVITTPPANTNADARTIASTMRYALVIARKDASFLSDVNTLISDLQADGVSIIGTVLDAN